MRQTFVSDDERIKAGVKASKQAVEAAFAPWAAVTVRVDGGWMCFESVDSWRTYRNAR